MITETTTEGKMHQSDPTGTTGEELTRVRQEGKIECATPNAADCGLDGDEGEKFESVRESGSVAEKGFCGMSDFLRENYRANIAALRIAACNADTGHEWTQVGNTFWYSSRSEEWVAISGGITMVKHIVTSQPRTVLALLDYIDKLRGCLNATRAGGNELAACLEDGTGNKIDVLRSWDETNKDAWYLLNPASPPRTKESGK